MAKPNNIVYKSKDGRIVVQDQSGNRYLFVDNQCQGVANLLFPNIPHSPYMGAMINAVYEHGNNPISALHIGGGACLVASDLARRYGVASEVIDSEYEMNYISKNFFDRREEIMFLNEDAKEYLSKLAATIPLYDLIFLDAYVGNVKDDYLYSKEGLELISNFLEPDGVLTINMVEQVKEAGEYGKLLKEVFKEVTDDVLKANKLDKLNHIYFCKGKK